MKTYILGGGAECFPVAYVWIISLDPLNFLSSEFSVYAQINDFNLNRFRI